MSVNWGKVFKFIGLGTLRVIKHTTPYGTVADVATQIVKQIKTDGAPATIDIDGDGIPDSIDLRAEAIAIVLRRLQLTPLSIQVARPLLTTEVTTIQQWLADEAERAERLASGTEADRLRARIKELELEKAAKPND